MTNVSVRRSTGANVANKKEVIIHSSGIVHIPSSSSSSLSKTPSSPRRFKTTWLKILVAVSIVVCFRTFGVLQTYSSSTANNAYYGAIDGEMEHNKPPRDVLHTTTPLLLQSISNRIIMPSASPVVVDVEQHPSDSMKHGPIIDLTIPLKTPRETIKIGEFPDSATGGATLEMFKGRWEPISTSNDDEPPTCPLLASHSQKFACDYATSRHQRRHKQYVASDRITPFNASLLVQMTKELGPIMFVGDSMSGQMKDALVCLLESQLGEWDESMSNVTFFSSTAIPIDYRGELMEDIEVLPGEPETREEFDLMIDLSWADEAIEKNVSYVVFNTGPWWNNELNFRVRGPWCDYSDWRYVSGAEMVEIYERSFRRTVIPILRRLRDDHGIVAIWRDVSSAGQWNERKNSIHHYRKINYYLIFPVLNRIGRRLVTELAGGLMLPIFDMSLDRWDDHILTDASYTNFDPMHWCINYNERDVPAVWNRLLFQVLFGDDGTRAGTEAAAIASNESLPTTDTTGQNNGAPYDNNDDAERTTEIKVVRSLRTNRRKLRVELERVPYSRSNETECRCSDAETFYHCVANIACRWVETELPYHCTEKKQN